MNNESNLDKHVLNNLTKIIEEYCNDRNVDIDKVDLSINEHENKLKQLNQRNQNLSSVEKIMKQYYMLMESLEFRMERHEQLTKLAQKLIKLTLIDQENRKLTTKK